MKWPSVVGAVVVLIGCAAQQQRPTIARPSDAGPEYETGLSRVLEFADNESQADALQVAYKFGYVAGQLEGHDVATRYEGERRELGCQGGFVAVTQVTGALPFEIERCATLKNASTVNASMEGAAYAEGRLTIVRKGIEINFRDPMVAAYQAGYALSFMVPVRRVGEYSAIQGQAVDGCSFALQLAMARATNANLSSVLASRCADIGTEIANEMIKARETVASRRLTER